MIINGWEIGGGGEERCVDMAKAGLGRVEIYCNQKEVQLNKR